MAQDPVRAPPEPPVVPLTGAEGAEGTTTGGEEGAAEATLGAGLAVDGAADAALGAKTPPVLLGGGATEVAVELGAEDDRPLADPPALEPVEPPQVVPSGGVKEAPDLISTDGPGSGNLMFPPALGLLHPFPMLATNIFGAELRLLKLPAARSAKRGPPMRLPSSRLTVPLPDPPLPPVTVIGAQFMYISWLPTLLNHVQARV